MIIVDRKKDAIITCPYCGREYLPAEIYNPNAFFGRPEDIDRDDFGHLESYDGSCMDLKDSYECDTCGKLFEVTAEVKFRVSASTVEEFDETYTAPIQSTRISLFEGIADNDNN